MATKLNKGDPYEDYEDEEVECEKKEKKEKVVPYYRLFTFATTLDKICILLASLSALLCGGLQPYSVILLGEVTGDIVNYVSVYNDNMTDVQKTTMDDKLLLEVQKFAIILSVIAAVMIVSTYVTVVLFSYSTVNQIIKMRKAFLQNTLHQDIEWFDTHQTGDFSTTFTQNISKIEEGIGEKVGIFLFFEATFVAGVVMALIKGWKLALVCLVSMPVSSVIMGFITWLSTKFSQQELVSYGAAGAIAEEVLSTIRTVVAFGGQEKEITRYSEHLVDAKNNNIKRSMFNSLSNGVLWFFVYGCYALSFWYGVGLILEDKYLPPEEQVYTPGNMVAVFLATLNATWNFGMGAPFLEIFATARGAAQKLFNVLDSKPKINTYKKSGRRMTRLKSNITFHNVYFSYPSRPDVKILNGFNLRIERGETVALVGNSGCGKSTCVQLLQRFYDPTIGAIFIDNVNIRDFNIASFRQKIGVVNQEPALFAATISENIRYGKLTATQSEIEEAAKKANAHKFISSLPMGYETVVGERGAQLSGGQKQRIAIARALVRRPEVLLLDEATSALDTTSEAEVQAALDSVSGQCTTIIVAHRLSTIRNAKTIIFVSDGVIVEKGTHSELMAAEGAYYRLVTSHGITDTSDINEDCTKITRSMSLSNKSYNDDDSYAEMEEEAEDDEEKEESTGALGKLMRLNKPEWFPILIGSICSIFTGASLPVYGMVFGGLIGVLANPDDNIVRSESNIYSLYFLILGIVTGVTMFFQMFSFGYSGEKLTFRIRKKAFEAMLRQEIAWFDRKENTVGALCAKLSGDASSVQGAAGVQIGAIINFTSTFLISCIFSLYFSWNVTLILLSFSPLILFSIHFEQKALQDAAKKNQKILEKSAKVAVEAIGNIRTVVSLGCEKVFLDLYHNLLLPYQKIAERKSHFRGVVLGMARSLILFAYAAGITYGAKLIMAKELDYSTFFQVSEVVIVGSWSIGNALSYSPNFNKGLMAASRIFALLERVPLIRNVSHPMKSVWHNENIEYRQMYFSYPTRTSVSVLNGLNLSVLKGQTVALVGASGCGKSTIIQLLERFYDPNYGEITVDCLDTKMMDLRSLRSQLGIVSQEPNLFDKTIAENIAYGANHRKVSMDVIMEAAKSANIHNFIASLPQGYETKLGSKGAQLSGGQKQRIAIARALVRNPKILLLDEATSALDNESQKIVQEALDNAKKGRTCITIAHRLTTIQDADVICVLNEGVIAEIGKHTELLEKRGLYYKFYKLQTGQT